MENTEFMSGRVVAMQADESRSINELAAALAKAQGSIRNAAKDAENPHFRSKYADLAAIWDVCRAPLSANGLAVMQRPRTTDAAVVLVTMLVHSSGQWVRDTLEFPVAQRTPQAYGSAITYARRYALAALVGVAADEDDDGNATSGPPRQHVERQTRQTRKVEDPSPSPSPVKEAKPPQEPKQSLALRARIAALWKHAQGKGSSLESFQEWAAQHIGRKVGSVEWTEPEVTKLEEIAKVATQAPKAASAPSEGCDHEWDLKGVCGKCGLGEPPPDEPGAGG